MKEIPLTRGYVALIDDDDFEWLSQWKWCALVQGNRVYAIRRSRDSARKTIRMHREICGAAGLHVDHANGNGLDNQRANLRPATSNQNGANIRVVRSAYGYKGVSRERLKLKKPWIATIRVNRRQINLGRYATAKEAAQAYDVAATSYNGEFAATNASLGLLP